MALTYAEAAELVQLAAAKGLRLGSTPYTYMGEAAQTAWKLIRAGKLGTVRVAYTEVNWNRIEVWHPAPEPFYDVGALYDVGVYPLTMLTAMFGPARRVHATSALLLPNSLVARDFNQLKAKLSNVVILVMAVTFLEHLVDWKNGQETMYFGIAVALVSAALIAFSYLGAKSGAHD